MGDTGNALLAAIAITAALYKREQTGVGQALGTSIVNAGLLATSYAWIHADGTPSDWGHVDAGQYGLSPEYRLHECAADTWLVVAALTDAARAALDEVVGGPGEREAAFASRPAAEWWAVLDAAGVPAEVVDEGFCRTVFDDPWSRDHGLVAETWAPGVGRFEDPGVLVSLSETPGVVASGPCACGEHSRSLLAELGYSDEEIDALAADQAILDAPVERPGP